VDDARERPDTLSSTLTLVPPVGTGLLSAAQQRALTTELVTTFLAVAEDPVERLSFLTQLSIATPEVRSRAGALIVQSRRAATRPTAVLDDYQSGFPSALLSSSGAPVSFAGVGVQEAVLMDQVPALETDLTNRFYQSTNGALLGWSGAGTYVQSVAPVLKDWRMGRFLSLRLAQKVPPGCVGSAPLSVQVEVSSAAASSTVTSDVFGTIAGVYEAHAPGGNGGCSSSAAFSTVRIPLEAFVTDAQSGLDLSSVQKVTVHVGPGPAVMALDDLEVER
jgi:hypothetical protein